MSILVLIIRNNTDEDIVWTLRKRKEIKIHSKGQILSIIKMYNENKSDMSKKEVYNKYHNIESPVCYCGKEQLFLSLSKGYLGYCSHDCKQKHQKYNIYNIISIIQRDGLVFSSYDYRQIFKFLNLSIEDLFKIKYPEQGKCILCGEPARFISAEKGFSKTCSYACGNKLQRKKLSEEEQQSANEKRKNTNIERYGVECNLSLLDRTGENNVSHNEITKINRKRTMIERYGVEHALQNKEIYEKQVATNISKYGETHIMKTEKGKELFRRSMLHKYNVQYSMQNKELVEKFKNSRIKNFSLRETEMGLDGVVYILYFNDVKLVKIGMSGNYKERLKSLYKDFGEFDIKYIIKTNSCRELELYFHEKFQESRVVLPYGCGKTEFFDENIINNIRLDELPVHLNYEFLFG